MKSIAVAFLLVLTTGAIHAATPEIAPPRNGDDWTKLNSTEKLFWSIGYAQGYLDALNKMDAVSGPGSACAELAGKERASSGLGKVTGFELVSGLEKFYSDGANSVIPVGTAIRIYLLRVGGADQASIQELIETARVLAAEASKRAQ